MALNKKTLQTRTLTATVFVAVMLAGLLINQWTFYLLFFVIHWGCWQEFIKLYGLIDSKYNEAKKNTKELGMLIGIGFLWFCLPHDLIIANHTIYVYGIIIMLICAVFFLIKLLTEKKEIRLNVLKYTLLGLLYISVSWGAMINLREMNLADVPLGYISALALIASIWINDTMQYIAGSLFGKTPFSKISPNKTLEGTIGGSLLCVIAVGIIGYFYNKDFLSLFIYIALVAAVIGTFGDLLESKIKRMAGVKDSGNFMPGHGGFLDRFDSLILSVSFVWIAIKWIMVLFEQRIGNF